MSNGEVAGDSLSGAAPSEVLPFDAREDILKWDSQENAFSLFMGAGLGVGGFFEQLLASELPLAASISGVAGVGLAALGLRKALQSRREGRYLHQRGQERIGESYEVHSFNDGLIVRWLTEDRPGEDILPRLEALLDEATFIKIAVDSSIIERLLPKDEEMPPECTKKLWSQHVAEKRGSGVEVRDPIRDEVILTTTGTLRVLLAEHKRYANVRTLDTLMTKLAELDHHSPIVKAYKDYERNQSLQQEKTLRIALAKIGMYLDKTESFPNEATQRQSSYRGVENRNGMSRAMAGAVTGRLLTENGGKEVLWTEPKRVWKQDAYQALGLQSAAYAQRLIDNPTPSTRLGREARQKALELAACQLLITNPQEARLVPSPSGDMLLERIPSDPLSDHSPKTPHRPIEQSLTYNTRRKRQAALALAFAGGCTALGGLIASLPRPDDDPPRATVRIGEVSAHEPNTAEWLIRPSNKNALRPDGYWVQGVASKLINGEWVVDYDNTASIAYLPTTPKNSAPNIQVVDQQRWKSATGTYIFKNGIEVKIPVLEGTEPVAADVGGRPVQLQTDRDNTFTLLLPPNASQNAKLEYWLASTDSAHRAKALHPITVKGGPAFDPQQVAAVWNAHVPPSDLPMPLRRANLVRDTFRYTLDPLHGRSINSYKNWTEITEHYFRNGEAVCNLAATELALANPAELNVAQGYYLRSDGDQSALAKHAGHDWNVTKDGQRIDSTPIRSNGQYDDYFDAKVLPNPEAKPVPSMLTKFAHSAGGWALGLVVADAAGYALYKSRRQLRKPVDFLRRSRIAALEDDLVAMGSENIGLAYATIQNTLYDKSGDPLASALGDVVPLAADDFLAKLPIQPALLDRETTAKLRDRRKATSDVGEQQQIRLAENLIRVVLKLEKRKHQSSAM